MKRKSKLLNWFEERYNLDGIKNFIEKKDVPIHKHSFWYYMGGLTLFLLIVQVISGILLTFYYQPGADTAYESVLFIMNKVKFGWLIRSIHRWTANFFIAFLMIHLFSVFFLKAYRKPRELTWVTGMLLYFLALGFGFSGYLLPWDTIALFATKVGTDIASSVPLIGQYVGKILRGGEDVTSVTLTRFYGIHISILPFILFAVLGLHLLLIQTQGMSIPIGHEDKVKYRIKFFPDFLLKDFVVWLFALGFIAVIATLFPAEVGKKADPFAPAPAGIRPEWYFLFMFQTLRMIPSKVLFFEGEVFGVVCFSLFFLVALLVPFLDRKASKNQKSYGFTIAGIIVLLYMVIMTILSLK